MDRKTRLHQKADELQVLLSVWATENKLLTSNEKLVVSIEVIRIFSLPVEVKVVIRSNEKVLRGDFSPRSLTDNDWQIINSLPWRGFKQRNIIETFNRSGNREQTVRSLSISNAQYGLMNSVFKRNGNLYRLGSRERGEWGGQWLDKSLKIFALV